MKITPASLRLPALTLLALTGTVRAASRPDPEGNGLRLRNGSLVESIYFKNAWLKEHPAEDAIIIPVEVVRGGRIQVTGDCAYTNRGAVFVHRADGAPVALPGLKPDALNHVEQIVRAFRPDQEEPEPGVGDDEAQIQRAYAALHDHEVMGYFPVAVSPLPSRVAQANGQTIPERVDWLIFDWNGGHYGYHPNVGVIRQPIPIDAATGQPFLAIALGDLVDSVIFCAEYRQAHPEERVALLFLPHHSTPGENTGGTAAAAYTRNGALYFHSPFFGDIHLTENGHVFDAGDIADIPRLFHAYETYLWDRFAAAYKVKYGAAPDPTKIHRGGREIVSLLGTREPQGLPGDTPELQVRRAYQRAQALGLASDVTTESPPDEPAVPEACLVLCWNISQYAYAPSRGGHYGVETDATVLPNRLIDGILFSTQYRRDHPGESALAIPYRESGSSKWKAVTVYVRQGRVWLHNPETGESLLPSCVPADLENPAKFKAIRLDGNQRIKAESVRGIKAKSARLNELPLNRTADASALDPAALHARLTAAGVPCQLLESTRERDATGHLREFPAPALTLQWWGVTYTYGPDHYCTASDGFIIKP